jgi:hypothetical protein
MHALAPSRGAPAAVFALPRRRACTRRAAASQAAAPPQPPQPQPLQPLRPPPPPQLPPLPPLSHEGGFAASQFVIPNLRRAPEPVLSDGLCFLCRPRAGIVTCPDCGGSGTLARGGYTRNNPVALKQVVGSKWTAHEKTFGWRHFRVLSRRKEGATHFVEARARGGAAAQRQQQQQRALSARIRTAAR